jgi:hypothetical protein
MRSRRLSSSAIGFRREAGRTVTIDMDSVRALFRARHFFCGHRDRRGGLARRISRHGVKASW